MNLPTIPDNLHKLLVILGLTLGIYSYITSNSNYDNYENKLIEYVQDLERLIFEKNQFNEFQKETLKKLQGSVKTVKKLQEIINTKEKYEPKDIEKVRRNLDEEEIIAEKLYTKSDSLGKLIDKKDFEIKLKELNVEQAEDRFRSAGKFLDTYYFISILLFITGIYFWGLHEDVASELAKRELIGKPTSSPHCQSCGKKFSSFVCYGSELNSQTNYHFCKECYILGVFTEPELTVDEVKIRAKKELLTLNIPSKSIKNVVVRIDKLHRWKKNNYI